MRLLRPVGNVARIAAGVAGRVIVDPVDFDGFYDCVNVRRITFNPLRDGEPATAQVEFKEGST